MNFDLEQNLILRGYKVIVGVDEAGRGPLAGPVFAAAVCLPLNFDCSKLNDSKVLSEKARERLFSEITEATDNYSIISLSSKAIDKIGILKATKRAMQKAIKSLHPEASFVVLDGINVNLPDIPQLQIIDGDAKIASIAAASILAKVSRDRYMVEMHKKYPQYNFLSHKGYGTKEHLETLEKHGPSPIHRITFEPVRKLIKNEN